ncbi:MAG: hypothetical protein AB7K63_16965 [Vicinamibacterales bacterium]
MERRGQPLVREVLEPDPLVEEYKRGVDRTLIRENLKLTPDQRLRKFEAFMTFLGEVRGAARRKR